MLQSHLQTWKSTPDGKLCVDAPCCKTKAYILYVLASQVMKERHPRYRRQPDVLLRLLAGWHMARLQVSSTSWAWQEIECGASRLQRQLQNHEVTEQINSSLRCLCI